MARSVRQSKILELISTREIETQDELVECLRNANFDITQATISRDIKELGLIKILSAETGNINTHLLIPASKQFQTNIFQFLKKRLSQLNLLKTLLF